jgi:hypothetical protein
MLDVLPLPDEQDSWPSAFELIDREIELSELMEPVQGKKLQL